jgi:hypothetical protein
MVPMITIVAFGGGGAVKKDEGEVTQILPLPPPTAI